MSAPPGKLHIVATPIGHLDDLSRRAEATLRQVDRILAEDTRRTRGLLSHFNITSKYVDRFDAHAGDGAVAAALAALERGEQLALVTDAGTPCVSDPGTRLVAAAAAAGIVIVPIPGASAVLTALAGAGLGDGPFRFLGFLPREGADRARALDRVVATDEVAVIFEASNRLADTLAELAALQPGRAAVVARELTKFHEEFVRGSLAELAAGQREWLGEIVLVLGPFARPDEAPSDEAVDAWIDEAVARGASAKDAAQQVAARSGRPRREVYARVLARRG
ncbi:MAG: 16S rRNA (cytidine(1402)-2'-O)-methyltransferase [Myxococcales bacterium]|nr:MAG: 16S rRNA (cytidine(1402)-2'-O)-methyltransferase [Myxococcales bacterium]